MTDITMTRAELEAQLSAARAAAMEEAAMAVFPALVDMADPRTNRLWLLEAEKHIRATIRALATTPPGFVCVKAEQTRAADWLRLHWGAFCDADVFPVDRDVFTAELEDAGLIELRKVNSDDLDDAFAYERGIEKGGLVWSLTKFGCAMLAAPPGAKE